MARYISATTLHPDGRIPGDELTLVTEQIDDPFALGKRYVVESIIGGGREAADALLSHVPLPTPREVAAVMLGRRADWKKGDKISYASKQKSGELATAITGQTSGNERKAVLRLIQRWADGTRKPSLETAQKYQQGYFAHTGKRNLQLERLIRAIEGRADVADLKPGLLNIIIKGDIQAYPGSDDIRNRPVKIEVKKGGRLLRIRAFDNPIEIWLELFHLETEAILLSCDWLFMEYVEA